MPSETPAPVFFVSEAVVARKRFVGVMSQVVRYGLVFALMGLSRPGGAVTLKDVAALAQTGAQQLALRLVNRDQPALNKDSTGWVAWEQLRISLYRDQHLWEALIHRVEALPEGVPADFRDWALQQQVDALLALHRGRAALRILRQAIWMGDPKPAALAGWRRLVIRSYLVDGRVDDAETALLRYRQDYGDGAPAWRLLQARVMLRSGATGDVAALLAGMSDPDARILTLLAQLRGRTRKSGAIARDARQLAQNKRLSADQRMQAWSVVAEAAQRDGDYADRVRALENALALPGRSGTDDGLFALDGDRLWDAYLAYGRVAANRAQLLFGQDQTWYETARSAADKHPVRARALYAVLALEGSDPQLREFAHLQLALSLSALKGGDRLLRALYLESQRFSTPERIPVAVRYRLVDIALEASQIRLASRLMRGLDQPPPGVDPVDWQMRRARVMILGGDPDAGIAVMHKLLDAAPALPSAQLDRIMQVLFDLQTIGRNEAALSLFAAIGRQPLDTQRRRELLFWMADSRRALGEHERAAYLYLRSATLADPFSMDQWAQTARYQAAEELTQAGLYDDAHAMYQSLLDATHDAGRQAVLQRKLQQLRLKESTATGSAAASQEQ